MPYHHYVSAFHLAHFTRTPERGRDAMICVLDLERRVRYRSAVRRAGGKGGYNAMPGGAGLDSEAIEDLFGRRYEGPAAPVLGAVNATLQLPTPPELDTLLDYVAYLSVNNPSRRGAMQDAQAHALRAIAERMVARPDTFEAAQADCRRDGVPLLGEIGYEELRAALADGSFRYDMPTEAHVRGMGPVVDALAGLLKQRAWSLLIATPDAPDFVCGDRPVLLAWTVERARALAQAGAAQAGEAGGGPAVSVVPPSFAMDGTEVLVPLGRRVALLGSYEAPTGHLAVMLPIVAEANRRSLAAAATYVFSAEPTSTFRDAHGRTRDSLELVEAGGDRPARETAGL